MSNVDLTEWNKALQELYKTSSRTYEQFVNGQMFALLGHRSFGALTTTARANKIKIKQDLMKPAHSTFKSRGINVTAKVPLAKAMILQRMAKNQKVPKGETMKDKMQTLIKSKQVSTSFIKSGWLPALRKFGSYVFKAFATKDTKQYGVDKGKGLVGKGSVMGCSAEATNSAMLNKEGYDQALKGLRKAMAGQMDDIKNVLYKRMQTALNKTNAK